MGITNSYQAYCFDEAITDLCQAIESEVEQAMDGAKNKKQAKGRGELMLKKCLADPEPVVTETGSDGTVRRFRNPPGATKTRR